MVLRSGFVCFSMNFLSRGSFVCALTRALRGLALLKRFSFSDRWWRRRSAEEATFRLE
jgi:hypothetical protein